MFYLYFSGDLGKVVTELVTAMTTDEQKKKNDTVDNVIY